MGSSTLTLRLFGTLQASIDAEPLSGLHLREGELLLAYLTLRHGVPLTYRELALVFWPSEARRHDEWEGGDYPSTRQAIRFLRRALRDHAWRLESVGKGVVRFDLTGADVDFVEFERWVGQEGEEADLHAIALYRGPLLEGWTQSWAQEMRARCQRSYERLKAAQPAPARQPTAPQPSAPSPFPAAIEADGGAVPLDSSFYIERTTDAAFRQAMARQDSIVLVKGAPQVGKTSLLARGLQQARQSGARVVRTDFQKLNEAQFASPETLYLALAAAITMQLNLGISPRQSWVDDLGPNMNLELFLRRHVLPASPEPLVWGMDGVDRLFTCDFGNEVFGLFRSWHNERSLDPSSLWSHLTLAIAYATEAHLFIQDLNQSPFNVGTRLVLDDFTREQVAELNRRYGEPLADDEVARFHALVGGQPYLARRGLGEMAAQGLHFARLEAEADRDEGVFSDHLRRLLASLLRAPELRDVVHALLAGQPCKNEEQFYRLRTAGVLAGVSVQGARFRCHLYALYLARHLG